MFVGNGLAGPNPHDAGGDSRLVVRDRDSHQRNLVDLTFIQIV